MRIALCALLTSCMFTACQLRADDRQPVPAVHPDTSQWQTLFASDLSDAVYPKGVWTVRDGIMTASKDEAIWSAIPYQHFMLDLEIVQHGAELCDWPVEKGLFFFGIALGGELAEGFPVGGKRRTLWKKRQGNEKA